MPAWRSAFSIPARSSAATCRWTRHKARDAVERNVAKPLGLSLEEAASGIIAVANANMIQAIRTLSVERGHDIRGFSLLAFGGAGPVYAAYMARELGMAEVIAPRHPGVFAASGLLMTDLRHTAQAAWQAPLAGVTAKDIAARLQALRADLEEELARDGVNADRRYFRYMADMRCVGQFHRLSIPLTAPPANGAAGDWWDAAKLAADFHAAHDKAYGHADAAVPVEFVNLRAEGFGRVPKPPAPRGACRSFRSTPTHRPPPRLHGPRERLDGHADLPPRRPPPRPCHPRPRHRRAARLDDPGAAGPSGHSRPRRGDAYPGEGVAKLGKRVHHKVTKATKETCTFWI